MLEALGGSQGYCVASVSQYYLEPQVRKVRFSRFVARLACLAQFILRVLLRLLSLYYGPTG